MHRLLRRMSFDGPAAQARTSRASCYPHAPLATVVTPSPIEQEHPSPWSIWLLLACTFGLPLQVWALDQVFRLLESGFPHPVTDFLSASKVSHGIASIAVMTQARLFCNMRYKDNIEETIGLAGRPNLHQMLLAFFCALLLTGLDVGIHFGLLHRDADLSPTFPTEGAIAYIVAYVLNRVLILPLYEEFFFRGLLYTWLRRHCALLPSLVLSASLFALAHGWSATTVLYIFSGTLYGYIYERTRILAIPIMAHSMHFWPYWTCHGQNREALPSYPGPPWQAASVHSC